jgi:FixJ family two-component response regulator
MSDLQKLVTVVDDDPEIRASMAMLLSAYGYKVETFDSAETFLSGASACRAMCLLVDIQLSGMSGVELALRLAAGGFKFPIIFMTGRDDAVIERQCFAAGAIALLRKPFPTTTLIGAIEQSAE